MSNFMNFSITVTILWTKLSRKAQRGNLAGASGVIWPVCSGSLCWIGRVAKRVAPIWLGSQPPTVAMRHNLPSRGWSTLRKSLLICCLSLATWLKGENSVENSGENSVIKRRELGRLHRQRREHHPARPAVPASACPRRSTGPGCSTGNSDAELCDRLDDWQRYSPLMSCHTSSATRRQARTTPSSFWWTITRATSRWRPCASAGRTGSTCWRSHRTAHTGSSRWMSRCTDRWSPPTNGLYMTTRWHIPDGASTSTRWRTSSGAPTTAVSPGRTSWRGLKRLVFRL